MNFLYFYHFSFIKNGFFIYNIQILRYFRRILRSSARNTRLKKAEKALRVCYFLDSFESGGIESFLTELILHLPKSINADIVAKRIGKSIFSERLADCGVRFFELSGKSHSQKNPRRFARLLQEEKYDAVHLNIFNAFDLRYAKIAKREGVSIRIAHAHGAGLRKSATLHFKMLIHRLSALFLLKYATVTLACSPVAARFVFRKEADGYIKNGIDTGRFAYSEEKRQKIRNRLSLDGKVVIGHVGRLSSEKNQSFLLEITREFRSICSECVLLLAGDGEDRDRLYELSERLGIGKSVIFYGNASEVEELYSAMDIFIFPSLFEGFGIAALEAQCSGLPVICSEGVPSEAIICENALRMPLSDGAKKWAEAALEMLSKASGRKSRCDQIKDAGYDIKKTALEVRKYYEST